MKHFFRLRQGCRALRMVEIGTINENLNISHLRASHAGCDSPPDCCVLFFASIGRNKKIHHPDGRLGAHRPERTRLIKELPPSSRRQATVHRTVAFYLSSPSGEIKIHHPDGWCIFMATPNGLEPSTSSVTGWRANRLHHRAKCSGFSRKLGYHTRKTPDCQEVLQNFLIFSVFRLSFRSYVILRVTQRSRRIRSSRRKLGETDPSAPLRLCSGLLRMTQNSANFVFCGGSKPPPYRTINPNLSQSKGRVRNPPFWFYFFMEALTMARISSEVSMGEAISFLGHTAAHRPQEVHRE